MNAGSPVQTAPIKKLNLKKEKKQKLTPPVSSLPVAARVATVQDDDGRAAGRAHTTVGQARAAQAQRRQLLGPRRLQGGCTLAIYIYIYLDKYIDICICSYMYIYGQLDRRVRLKRSVASFLDLDAFKVGAYIMIHTCIDI